MPPASTELQLRLQAGHGEPCATEATPTVGAIQAQAQAQAQEQKSLVKLPAELLNSIASGLNTNDFNALRLTCKPLENKLFSYWSNSFFRKKQFMIELFSLQTLIDISQHDALSKVIRHLVIGLDQLGPRPNHPRALTIDQFHFLESAMISQKRLLDQGLAIDLLSRALARLPNLKTIDIRDFNSQTRYRDTDLHGGQVPEWRSYGYSAYHPPGPPPYATGFVPSRIPSLINSDDPDAGYTFVCQVFNVVLNALGRCPGQVQSLEVILRQTLEKSMALTNDAFAIFPGINTNIVPALGHLTKLHLDLSLVLDWLPLLKIHPRKFGNADLTDTARSLYIRRFLSFTRNLTWLRLNIIDPTSLDGANVALLEWLGMSPGTHPPPDELGRSAPPWSDINPAPVALPLRQLDLGGVHVGPDCIRNLMTKFQDLEAVTLKAIQLLSSDKLDDDSELDGGENLWSNFFRALPKLAPKLKRLAVRYLRQVHPGNEGIFEETMVFLRNPDTPANGRTYNAEITEVNQASLDHLARRITTLSHWHARQLNEREHTELLPESDEDGDSNDEEESISTEN